MVADTRRCGYVAIVGRPNVGKSTLLNHLLGQKISITSRKPQTTRHRLLGIKTDAEHQIIFVDTPGLHKDAEKAINRYMNRAASAAIRDVDLVVYVVDRTAWTDEDELVLAQIKKGGLPCLLVINKVDLLEDKSSLLPHIESLQKKSDFAAVLPVSALRRHNVIELEREIVKRLPVSAHFFPEDQITDRSQRFLAAEIVREKIMRQLGDEIPYAITVEIEEFSQVDQVLHISALILERKGQKKILIGEGGSRLRSIGSDARCDMELMFDSKVMLRLWVKVKSGWSDDERALRSLGYDDELTMRISLQPAYVLHTRPYRDSSLLLEVLTAEHGRISLVARGARRRARGGSSGALLQPFIPLLLSFSGRRELKTLTGLEAAGPPAQLRGERMFSGLYLNELLVRLLHRYDPHPQLFATYAATLGALAQGGEIDEALRRFEFSLLGELGYGFELDREGHSGDVVRARDWYHYHPDYGLVARDSSADPSLPAFEGADLLAMASGEFGGAVGSTAKRLLRQVLALHLGDTPLRSRELFRAQSGSARRSDHMPVEGKP